MQQIFKWRLFLVMLSLLCETSLFSQQNNGIEIASGADSSLLTADTGKVLIRNIFITGNKKTKEYIILREIPFHAGDIIDIKDLIAKVERGRENVFNTRLFIEVAPGISNWKDGAVDISFKVRERWYFFPLPYFKLVDRNLNQWIDEQNASLKRVNYGLKFAWNNVSGRNDKLRVNLVTGYSRLYNISYEQPFADKKLKHGFIFAFSFNQNRQINVMTDSNRQKFFPVDNKSIDAEIVRRQVRFDLGYSYRPDIYSGHAVRLVIADEKNSDTIAKLNPNYFLGGRTRQVFPELSYSYAYTNVDSVAYPLRGVAYNFSLTQRGLGMSKGMNLWQLDARISKFITLAGKNHFSFQLTGKLKLPFNQPYYNLRAMGYGNFFLRGLENYVVDGVASFVAKFTFRRKIVQFSIPTIYRKGAVYKLPFKIYAKTFSDTGYSYLQNPGANILNNKLIYTAGLGLDIITIYDFQIKLDFSFNQLGQNGLFLNTQRD